MQFDSRNRRATPRRLMLMGALALVTSGLAGCNHTTEVCTPDIEGSAVVVAITDSVSGAPAASGATLTANFGTATLMGDSTTDGLHIRVGSHAGTYDLRITKPGYVDWVKSGVVVTAQPGSCGTFNRVTLNAALVPTP